MIWWSALGLALALYGIVVLAEWLYDELVQRHMPNAPAISVVVRVANQEDRVEQVIRQLEAVFSQRDWLGRSVEVLLVDAGSWDLTEEILRRMSRSRSHCNLSLIEKGRSTDDILKSCTYPLVIWLDLLRSDNTSATVDGLGQLLNGFRRA